MIRIDRLSEIRDHIFLSQKLKTFSIPDADCLVDGINILCIKIAPKQDTSLGKAPFLILHSPYKRRTFPQDLTVLDELHQSREVRLTNNGAHC
jgi:hypothetical protein